MSELRAGATNTGKLFERQVADLYRALGARRVEHDREIAGHQIDVYVEFDLPDGANHRIAVDAKDHSKPVGILLVRDFRTVAESLRNAGEIESSVMVGALGFTKPARNHVKGISWVRLIEPADLKKGWSKQTLSLILQKAKVFWVESPAENRAVVTIFITPSPTYLKKDKCSCLLTVSDSFKAQQLPMSEVLETSGNVEETSDGDLNVKGPGSFKVHTQASSVDDTIPEDYTDLVQLTFKCVPETETEPMLTEEVTLTWVPEEGKAGGGVWQYPDPSAT